MNGAGRALPAASPNGRQSQRKCQRCGHRYIPHRFRKILLFHAECAVRALRPQIEKRPIGLGWK